MEVKRCHKSNGPRDSYRTFCLNTPKSAFLSAIQEIIFKIDNILAYKENLNKIGKIKELPSHQLQCSRKSTSRKTQKNKMEAQKFMDIKHTSIE